MSQLSDSQKKKLFWISFPTLCLISLCLIILTIIPQSREWIRSLIIQNSRVILAKVDGYLLGNETSYTVIKVKTADTLALEIFQNDLAKKESIFIKRIVLNEKRDGHFNFRGNVTNLAFSDIDNDGTLEIISPTFDENLIPRLNVFKFDKDRLDFIKLGPNDG